MITREIDHPKRDDVQHRRRIFRRVALSATLTIIAERASRAFARVRRTFTWPHAIPLAVGGVLLVAASLKGRQLAAEPTYSSGVIDSRPLQIAVVEFELALGIWLLSRLHARLAKTIALGCFCAFACTSFARGIMGKASCGCFGTLELSPWVALLIDVSAIATLLMWHPITATTPPKQRRATAVLLLAAVAVVVPSAWRMRTYALPGSSRTEIPAGASTVAISPNHWTGHRCPLLPWIDIAPQLEHGTWTVVLFRAACPHCRDVIHRHERKLAATARSTPPNVAIVELPPWATDELPTTLCVRGRLSDKKRWITRLPVELTLVDAVVQAVEVAEGQLAGSPERKRQVTVSNSAYSVDSRMKVFTHAHLETSP